MRLTNQDFIKIAFRSYFIRLFYNYRSLFGEGLCYCLLSYARKKNEKLACFCPGEEAETQVRNLLKRHMGFFNANEYLVCLAIGIILRLEEQQEVVKLEKIKTVLKSTLGALGDNLIYKLIKPILVFYPIVVVFLFNFEIRSTMILILIIPYLIFNLFNFMVRFYGAKLGYLYGIKSLRYFKSPGYSKACKTLNLLSIILVFLSLVVIFYHLFFRPASIDLYILLNRKEFVLIFFLSFCLLWFRRISNLNSIKFNGLLVFLLLVLPTIYCFL